MTLRRALLGALEQSLFPEIARAGFDGTEAEEVEIDDISPPPRANLYHFRRNVSGVWSVITVDVKSFQRPTFVVIGGNVPPEGVKIWCPGEFVSPERVSADMLEVQARLQASASRGYSPFRPSLLAYAIRPQSATIAAVERALVRLPDLMHWLETGHTSPYVRVVKFPRPSQPSVP